MLMDNEIITQGMINVKDSLYSSANDPFDALGQCAEKSDAILDQITLISVNLLKL